jgi:hypothetical protein
LGKEKFESARFELLMSCARAGRNKSVVSLVLLLAIQIEMLNHFE